MSRPTPLAGAYARRARGITELLGWQYPREFSGAHAEHHAVRPRAGLFDFSFMAHVTVRGPDALPFYDPSRSRVRTCPELAARR